MTEQHGYPATWTAAEREELCRYLRWVADELGLRDWTLTLKDEPSDDDCFASVLPTDGRYTAAISVCRDFRSLSPEKQRNAIVHELLHIPYASAADVVRLDLQDTLGSNAYWPIFRTFHRLMEYATDGLASAIDKHYPLIEWPEPEAATEPEPAVERRWQRQCPNCLKCTITERVVRKWTCGNCHWEWDGSVGSAAA